MSAQGMPPQVLALFAPRLPLEYMPPLCSNRHKRVYQGIAEFKDSFENIVPPPVIPFETPRERKERKKKEKLLEHRKKQEELVASYDPHATDCATKNPYATLFVGRLSYEVTEKKLKKEFECYGPIKRVKVITDFNGKSRGYAFIEYETEEALKAAYKQGDGKKIDGRRVLVDVERSRTVPGWVPRRLGGGKGPARFTEPKKKKAIAVSSGDIYSSSSSRLQSSSSHRPSWNHSSSSRRSDRHSRADDHYYSRDRNSRRLPMSPHSSSRHAKPSSDDRYYHSHRRGRSRSRDRKHPDDKR